jgi:hypothetical protein
MIFGTTSTKSGRAGAIGALSRRPESHAREALKRARFHPQAARAIITARGPALSRLHPSCE